MSEEAIDQFISACADQSVQVMELRSQLRNANEYIKVCEARIRRFKEAARRRKQAKRKPRDR